MYLNEKAVLTSNIVLIVFSIGAYLIDPNFAINLEFAFSVVMILIGVPLCVAFLRFITDGSKTSKKSPYNDIALNAWSYIWRYFITMYIAIFPLAGVAYLIPILKSPLLAGPLMIVFFCLLSVLFFAKDKKGKITNLYALVSSRI